MLKRLLIGTLTFSSLAFAQPPVHQAVPLRVPPPPPPAARPMNNPVFQDARRDAAQGADLLRAFDAAVARRDFRAMRVIERQFAHFLTQELREARLDARPRPQSRAKLARLMELEDKLERLQGRVDRRALRAKQARYAELVELAGRDVRGGHRF